MTRSLWIAAAGIALAFGVAAPPAYAKDIKKVETAANLADLGKLIGAVAAVSFQSDLPGALEAEDVLKAFGMTAKDESGIVFDVGFDATTAKEKDRVLYYDDAGMTTLSDGIRRLVDANGKEAFAFQSDNFGTPEPATWTMLLLGFAAIGVSLRRRPRIQVPASG